jgi:hypothetical protein
MGLPRAKQTNHPFYEDTVYKTVHRNFWGDLKKSRDILLIFRESCKFMQLYVDFSGGKAKSAAFANAFTATLSEFSRTHHILKEIFAYAEI